MFKFFENLFKNKNYKEVGIDLGTANTIVYVKGEGIVINEPSYVSINNITGNIDLIGQEAREMFGRTPSHTNVIKPLKNGVISDYEITEKMLSTFINSLNDVEKVNVSKVVICIPSGVTQVEKRAVIDSVKDTGVKKVFLVEEPIAAAIGANIDIFEPKAHLIVDIGGGTTEISFVVSGGASISKSIKVAGDHMNVDIMEYIKEKYKLYIGEKTAEDLKILANNSDNPEEEYKIKGKELGQGLPKLQIVKKEDIDKAIYKQISSIIYNIKSQLEEVSPEIASDIYDTGIYLAGGGANIKLLKSRIEKELNLTVHISDNPLFAVINGVAKILDDFDKYSNIIIDQN